MGRRGHVQTRPPKYDGSCITDWAQDALYEYLTNAGLEVSAPGQDCNVGDADHWEIAIPEKERRGRFVHDFDAVLAVAKTLREHPDELKDDEGAPHGEVAASILEEGVEAAKRYKLGTITIDWW